MKKNPIKNILAVGPVDRKDLLNKIDTRDLFWEIPRLELNFNWWDIPYKEIESEYREEKGYHIPTWIIPYWEKIKPGRSCADSHPKWHFFQELKLHPERSLPTLRAWSNSYYHYKDKRRLFDEEIIKGGSFPSDYNFLNNKAIYLIWMSVPPLMTYWIAQEIYKQWLSKI